MNWKEKVVAFSMLLGLLCLSLFVTPTAQATTCKECLLQQCNGVDAFGWMVNRILVQNGSSLVLVKNFKCDSSGTFPSALYWDCEEYGNCVSFHNKPGLLFHLDRKNQVTVFNIKDRKEADAIEASLDYQGLDITVGKWKPRVVLSASELVQPSIQTLAKLGFAESGSCTVSGK